MVLARRRHRSAAARRPAAGIEGPALARQLRIGAARQRLPRLPIVALRRSAPVAGATPDTDIDDVLEQPAHIPTLQSLLRRLVGHDPGVVREMLRDYLIPAQKRAALLRRAYQLGDPRQVGALELGELCAAMVLPARTDFDTHGNDLARFDDVFDTTVATVRAHLKWLGP